MNLLELWKRIHAPKSQMSKIFMQFFFHFVLGFSDQDRMENEIETNKWTELFVFFHRFLLHSFVREE